MKLLNTLLCGAMIACGVTASAAVNADSIAAVPDKAPTNVTANLRAGQAMYSVGNITRARQYLSRGGNDAQAWLALLDLEGYDFDGATARAEKYLASKHEAASEADALARKVLEQAETGRNMLDRVEKVIVIDSIVVDKPAFFKAFKISAPTGRITDTSHLPSAIRTAGPTSVYVSESGERMLWSRKDASGKMEIVESNHLADGSWEKPHAVGDHLQLGGDANYPFLLSDGMTLYYASNGDGSLGGYDIYVTRNDGDRYLNPQNIGMPYNSPMDDYLLAIDDATGVGWWATDRNRIPGMVTVYVFVPQELRDNYPVDGTPDLIDRARITSIASTHREGESYKKYLDAVRAIDEASEHGGEQGDFRFALPDGRVITDASQLTEPEARELLGEYLNQLGEFNDLKEELLSLRARYAKGDTSLAFQILEAEENIEQMRTQLSHMVNDVVKSEIRE